MSQAAQRAPSNNLPLRGLGYSLALGPKTEAGAKTQDAPFSRFDARSASCRLNGVTARGPAGMARKAVVGNRHHRMLGVDENPAIGLATDVRVPIYRRHMDQQMVRESVDIEKHVAAAIGTIAAVTRGLRIDIADFFLAGCDREGAALDHGDQGEGTAARIGAIGTEAEMHLCRLLVVFEPHRVAVATAPASRKYGHLSVSSKSKVNPAARPR
jgi:hypothetical protein